MAKIERTKNASRNIIFGIILKIYQILVPFLMRTAMIYFMGVEYLGLNSLFTSILSTLNLAELGVGSAMIFSMYKPIAEDDEKAVCALLNLYRVYYRIIGCIILVIGTILTPFIPKLINGQIPTGINIYVIYFLNLIITVISYWLFAYKNSILQVHQRIDIISKVSLVISTIQYILQLLVLWILRNYYMYVLVLLLTQAINNIAVAYYAKKIYPQFQPFGKVGNIEKIRINQRIRDLFTAKIGGVIYDSADSIVISAFLGLTQLAIYQNYFYILNSISGFITVIFSACTAGIGNSLVLETQQKNLNDLNKFTFIICWISGFCSCSLLCLYQPFMEIWVGKKFMLNNLAVICFVIYFFIRQFNALLNLYKDAAGIWHQDRLRPLIAALTNLILNLVLIKYIGIYGVILSTVIAIAVVGEPWILYNIFTVIFSINQLKPYLKKVISYIIVVVLSCVITYFICEFIKTSLYFSLALKALICCIIPNFVYCIFFRKTKEFKSTLILANQLTKGKFYKIIYRLSK